MAYNSSIVESAERELALPCRPSVRFGSSRGTYECSGEERVALLSISDIENISLYFEI